MFSFGFWNNVRPRPIWMLGDPAVSYWTPAQITTAAWFNPSDLSSVTAPLGSISQILDKSGNNNHATQSIASSQPTSSMSINGMGAIECNYDYMNMTNELLVVRSAFFITSRMAGSSGSANISSIFGSSNTQVSPSNYIFVRSYNDDYTISIDGTGDDSGHASVSGGSLVAGSDIDLGISQAQKLDPIQWYTDFDDSIKVGKIGYFDRSGIYPLNGDLGEMIFLDFIPTTEIRQKIEGYLAWNWGLEDDLPALHPYKSGAPTL